MEIILTSIIPLFLLILIGYGLQKSLPPERLSSQILCKIGLGSCETTTSVLNRFALYLALPALIISSLINARGEQLVSLQALALGAGALLVFFILIALVVKHKKIDSARANTYLLCALFGNVAYIGLPFLSFVYTNSEAAVSIIIALHVAFTFTIGLAYLEWSTHQHLDIKTLFKACIKNPLALSVIAGVLLYFVPVPIPRIISRTLEMLGSSASPVVLVAVGTFMATQWHPRGTIADTLRISTLKLFVLPLLTYIVGYMYIGTTGMQLIVLEAAMPVALTNFALSEIYPMKQRVIANSIIVSTFASIATLSLWTQILL